MNNKGHKVIISVTVYCYRIRWSRSRQGGQTENDWNSAGKCSQGRGPKLGADMGAGNDPTPLHRQPQPQFRLKQQQLKLASATGIGKKILCPTIWVLMFSFQSIVRSSPDTYVKARHITACGRWGVSRGR